MDSDETESEPAADKAHLHRPMNAFLLFCKQHRPVVREKHPSIENRAVTKILGEWWSNLEEADKSPYTSLAHQYKEAFMKANPEFRWHKMPPGTADSVPPSNVKPSTPSPTNGMVCSPASSLLTTSNSFHSSDLATSQDASSSPNSSASAPKPFKKRYLASQLVCLRPKTVQEALPGLPAEHQQPGPADQPRGLLAFFGGSLSRAGTGVRGSDGTCQERVLRESEL